MELLNPSEDSVYLEGESPSLGLSIVFFEHVDVLSAQILPVSDGFFDPLGFGDLLPEDLKESRLATPDVAFDGEARLRAIGQVVTDADLAGGNFVTVDGGCAAIRVGFGEVFRGDTNSRTGDDVVQDIGIGVITDVDCLLVRTRNLVVLDQAVCGAAI